MAKKLTSRQKAEVQKQELKTRTLVTIHLDNTIRILENDTLTSFEIDGEIYLAGMVTRSEIETSTEGALEKVEIKISNVNQGISSLIATQGDVLTNARCTVDAVIFDSSSNTILDEPVKLFEGCINTVEINAIELKFAVERVIGGYSTLSPNFTYDVNCQCIKFKDERCGYTGTETKCDKTLTRCIALNNYANFFGFPSIPQEMVVKG